MNSSIVHSLVPCVADSMGKIKKLIQECPDNLWNEKSGGWPVWQHVAHSISASDFFTPGPPTAFDPPLTKDLIQLNVQGTEAVPKKVILDYYNKVETKVGDYLNGLNDIDLTKPNENTAKIGLNWDISRTIVLLAAHPLYHLGYGDAVLRNNGLKGIF
jgi:hypothetical protein